jgi:hypothetical protein
MAWTAGRRRDYLWNKNDLIPLKVSAYQFSSILSFSLKTVSAIKPSESFEE